MIGFPRLTAIPSVVWTNFWKISTGQGITVWKTASRSLGGFCIARRSICMRTDGSNGKASCITPRGKMWVQARTLTTPIWKLTGQSILMNTMKTAISASTGFIMMFTTRKTSIRKLTNAPCINTKHCMKATESLPSFIWQPLPERTGLNRTVIPSPIPVICCNPSKATAEPLNSHTTERFLPPSLTGKHNIPTNSTEMEMWRK